MEDIDTSTDTDTPRVRNFKSAIGKNKFKIGIFILLVLAIISFTIWFTVFKEPPAKVNYSYTPFVNSGGCVVSEIDNSPLECGIGKQKQERKYIPAQNGGEELAKPSLTRYVSCEAPKGCPVDGYYREYENDGNCMSKEDKTKPITCGPGTQKQTAPYVRSINGGSDKLEGTKLPRWVDCKLDDCIPTDGTYTPYKRIGPCVKSEKDNTVVTCGNAVQKQIRDYVPAKYGGKEISPELRKLEEYASCDLDACPPAIDATCSEWSYGTNLCECSKDGLSYQIKQTRTYTPPVNGGMEVKDLTCKTETSRTVLCNSNAKDPPPNSTPNGKCPSPSVFVKYPEKNEKLCTPLNGPNRTQQVSATYTFPIGGNSHHIYILDGFTQDQIDSIQKLTQSQSITVYNTSEKLNVTFKRINSTQPEQYTLTKNMPCDVVPWHTENEINTMWNTETGCSNKVNTALTSIGKKMVDLQNIEKGTNIIPLFSQFKTSELMKTYNKENIDICYGSDIKDEKAYFMVIDRNKQFNASSELLESAKPLPIIIPPSVQFNNEAGNVIVLQNGNYVLHFRQNGDLFLETPSGGKIIMSNKNGKNLKLLRNGKLVITDGTNTAVATKTSDKENAHLHLSENGTLALIDIENKTILTKLDGPDVSDFITKGAIFTNKYYGVSILKNMNCELILQTDGNLVLYKDNTPIWNTNTYGIKYLVMHDDSHLIMYDNSFNSDNMGWRSNTIGYTGYNLYLTASGYLIFRLPGKTGINDPEFVLHPQKEGKANYPNKLYATTLFTNTRFDKVILKNGQYTLRMQTDGNLILSGGNSSWATNIYGSGFFALLMRGDGNLILYNDPAKIGTDDYYKWYSQTGSNNGAYLHLNDSGYLVMRKSNNDLLKIFYPVGSMDDWCQSNADIVKNRIIDYLKSSYYDTAPYTLFTSKKGYVWKATWSELDKEKLDDIFKEGTGNRRNFRGFSRNRGDSQWDIKQINLKDIKGFTEYNDIKPSGEDNGIENYSSSDSVKEWARNCNNKIKPLQLDGGGSLTNYIPGYLRITGVANENDHNTSYKYLIYYKPGNGDWDLGFVLYQRNSNRDDFANDIYNNNPELIRDLKKFFCNENLSKI